MHNPKQRQRDLAKRTLTYALMTLSVIALVVVSLFLVLGYSVDSDGQPEQGGLIQFRSFPTGATVSVDGAKQDFTTNGKKNTGAGYHNVTMELKKYRSWAKSFDLGRGELLWLNALLIPKHITTSEVQSFEQLGGVKFSPDKKWIAVIEKSNEPKLKIVDIRDEKKPRVSEFTIPEIVAKQNTPADNFKIVEWDFGSRYLLVKHTSGDKTEWLRLDRNDNANSKNISILKSLSISDAHFVGNSGNVFYVLAGGNIHKIDISNTTEVLKTIADNVKEFELYKDNTIAYVGTQAGKQIVGYYNDADTKPREVKSFKADEPNVHTVVSSYFNDDYQAISHDTVVNIVKDPKENKQPYATFKLAAGVQWLYFANNGRFVVAQNGSSLSVYDLERKQNFVFSIPNKPAYASDQHLKWLDDFHLVSDAGGTLTIFEYDGTNAETIGKVSEGYDISLSDNGKRLFDIAPNTVTGKPALQSSVMVIE